ncbi:MAG: hypothetical protein Q4E87_02645 [bacterium]|nr:hypothetical protein [bacterium]
MKFSAVQDIVDFIAEDIKYTISEIKEYDNFDGKDRMTDFQHVKISIISSKKRP